MRLRPSIEQMLTVAQGCGLKTVSEAYTYYINHSCLFFFLPKFDEQFLEFNIQIHKKQWRPECSIEAAIKSLK